MSPKKPDSQTQLKIPSVWLNSQVPLTQGRSSHGGVVKVDVGMMADVVNLFGLVRSAGVRGVEDGIDSVLPVIFANVDFCCVDK